MLFKELGSVCGAQTIFMVTIVLNLVLCLWFSFNIYLD